jgi:biopolymer transport protein ExbD
VVRVDANGALNYDGDRYHNARGLARRLNSARENGEISAVIVQAHADATLDVTVGALDALSGAGVAPLSLATGPGGAKP